MKKWITTYLGKNRVTNIAQRSAKAIAKKLTVPTIVVYGEEEAKLYPRLKVRCEETVEFSKNSKLVIAKNAPHDISHPEYVSALKKAFEAS